MLSWFLCGLVCLSVTGCTQIFQNGHDVEKDPHFLRGQAKARHRNFRGAIDSFEKAIRSNPNNWAAHYELGLIYYNDRMSDWPAAIYHFRKLLRLKADHHMADQVNDYIRICKGKLASEVNLGSVQAEVQRQLVDLQQRNRQLQGQVGELRTQLASLSSRSASGTAAAEPPSPESQPTNPSRPRVGGGGSADLVRSAVLPSRSSYRAHRIKPRDTLWGIAHRYGITVDDLKAANPDLNPRALPIGKSLRIPAR